MHRQLEQDQKKADRDREEKKKQVREKTRAITNILNKDKDLVIPLSFLVEMVLKKIRKKMASGLPIVLVN